MFHISNYKQSLLIVLPSFNSGGAEKVGINLANHYSSTGLSVQLVVLVRQGDLRNTVSPRVKINDLSCSRSRYCLFRLRNAIITIKPDVVLSVLHSTNVFTALSIIGLKNKPKIVFREATLFLSNFSTDESRFKTYIYKLLTKFCYKYATKIISNSSDTEKSLFVHSIIKKDKSIVVPNPVIPARINEMINVQVNHKWFDNNNFEVVLNIARLNPEKDHITLIKAFHLAQKERESLRLIIIGDGPMKNIISNLISELSLVDKVCLIDYVKNPYPYYKKSSVFLLTSIVEGFGNVIVEALSVGLPVISTDVSGGVRNILDKKKYGQLVSRNPSDISNAILNNNKLKHNRDALINRAKFYSVSNISSIYLEVLLDKN